VLNSIDAIHRRRLKEPETKPDIRVVFNDREPRTLEVADNGDGMDKAAVLDLFARVGASASKLDGSGTVGEFGIGVVSYFMAGNSFVVQTFDGVTEPIGLRFTREMLAGGAAEPLPASRTSKGTTITIELRNREAFSLLQSKFQHWCRDVDGLVASVQPEGMVLEQGSVHRPSEVLNCEKPNWVERAHLSPITGPNGWESMTGSSTISVLYRGVFVQEYTASRLWGIEGSIDVDPKHFKPRLNREGFVAGPFEQEVNAFLAQLHPAILLAMAQQLSSALEDGKLDKWAARRWATLWLSVPRDSEYSDAVAIWDRIFRRIPAFEIATGNKWEEISLERLLKMPEPFYVAPLRDDNRREVVQAALRLLRHTGGTVVRGLQADRHWLRDAKYSFNTTADLIANVFASELPALLPLEANAEKILNEVKPVATLFPGSPVVELVRLGKDGPPLLRLRSRIIINIENQTGNEIVREVVTSNLGRWSLIAIVARLSNQHTSEIAAAMHDANLAVERLGLVKRRFLRGLLTCES